LGQLGMRSPLSVWVWGGGGGKKPFAET